MKTVSWLIIFWLFVRWVSGVCEAKKSTDEAIKKLEDAKKQLAEAADRTGQDRRTGRTQTSATAMGFCGQAGGKVSEAEA